VSTGGLAILLIAMTSLLSIVGTLALIIFNDMRHQLRDHARHIEGMLASLWPLTMRVNGVEDFLADRDDYRPPRIIGDHEGH
jgi:hypothetical protein